MFFSVSIEVCECLVSKDFFVVGDEVVKFGVEFLDFLLMFACDVFIDLSVSKVLVDALVDVGVSQHDDDTHVLICPDCYEFFVVG